MYLVRVSYIADTEGLGAYFQVENWMYVRPLVDADLNKLSANEQQALSDAIDKYAGLSYDEIKEKSHDTAWRSTARDFSTKNGDIYIGDADYTAPGKVWCFTKDLKTKWSATAGMLPAHMVLF